MKSSLLSLTTISLVLILLIEDSGAARAGGRGGKGKGSKFGSRMLTNIRHRNPASASYYDNKDGARIIKSSHFELDYLLGRKITFVHEWHMGNDTIKSKMEIDPTTQKDAGYYECQADNQYAIDRRGFRTDF
ncbi:hypothetical protein M8J75_007695 [Diaphorina citri]|nr:hypothetical protein M8J75_007695 [Diaphorina citri]